MRLLFVATLLSMLAGAAQARDFWAADLMGQWWIGIDWTMATEQGEVQTCLLNCRFRVYDTSGDMHPGDPERLSCNLYMSTRSAGRTSEAMTVSGGSMRVDANYPNVTFEMTVDQLGTFASFGHAETERHKSLYLGVDWPDLTSPRTHGVFTGWVDTPFGVIARVRAVRTRARKTGPF